MMSKKNDVENLIDEKIELTIKQEKFCQTYVSESEFFGNGVKSYIKVYDPVKTNKNRYNIACSTASEILSNPKVCARINQLLEIQGLNDENVDKQLLFLINQHSEKAIKLGAIKEYNTLKARIEKGRQKALNDGDITEKAITNVNIIIGNQEKIGGTIIE